jgi:hypothetical protein
MATSGIKRAWRTILVPAPAAGTDWSLSPGGQRYFRVTSLVALLTTGIAAPARQVLLQASRGGNAWFRQPAVAGIGASAAVFVSAFTGAPRDGSFINTLTIPLPVGGLLLRPGDTLAAVTASLDAADQWSTIVVEAEEIPSGYDYEGDQLATPTETA